jgi:hypothetical protein
MVSHAPDNDKLLLYKKIITGYEMKFLPPALVLSICQLDNDASAQMDEDEDEDDEGVVRKSKPSTTKIICKYFETR